MWGTEFYSYRYSLNMPEKCKKNNSMKTFCLCVPEKVQKQKAKSGDIKANQMQYEVVIHNSNVFSLNLEADIVFCNEN